MAKILIFFCLLAVGNASAQGFLQTYSPESSTVRTVLQAPDGGYFLAGENQADTALFLLRVDAAGQSIWSQHLAINGSKAIAACVAADSGFVVLLENHTDTFYNQKNMVLKLSPSGSVEWQQVVDNLTPFFNGLKDIIALSDGSFLAAGTIPVNFTPQTWLVKIAADGAIIWQKSLGESNKNVKKLVELPTGNLVLAGGSVDLYLAKVNLNGDLLWEKNYPVAETQTFYDLLVTAEGNIALLGTSPDPGLGILNICILKTDLDGNELWYKNHYPFPPTGGQIPVLNHFAQDDAGNFYIPFWGFESDPLDADLELLKLASDGTALWKNVLNVTSNPWDILKTADNHLVIAGDNNGEPSNALLLKTDFEGDFLSNKITGNVFSDEDMDCSFTMGEPGLAAFIVKAKNQSGEAFYKKTNPDGSYEIRVTEGDFELSVRPSFAPPTLYAQCDTPMVSVSGMSQTVVAPAIASQILGECPLLSVELSSGLLRRCTTAVYNASWCNTGNLPAENASLQIVVNPFLDFVSSTIPLAGQAGDTLSFLLGDVLPGVCSTMNIVFNVHCDAQLNDVLCAEAHIFPDTSCAPLGLQWDGSKIEVTGACNGSEIEFTIRNTGLGDMTEIAEYVIIEDQIMYMQNPLQLNAGQEITTIRTPMPDDSCFALQVFPNQHSILRKPVAVVANCTSNGNLNLLLNLPNNENDPAIAVHCDAVVGSYDPNDKVGFPLGLTDAHFIEQGQDIEYRVRFQNTGNDTAFLIRIFDTLPITLDPATIRPMAASHPYNWDVTANGQLIFTFANILLPDSTSNEPASHGFVSFRISQKTGLTDGTFVDNSASIYFDFNEPVLTNTWRHTIGRPETVSVKNPVPGMKNVQVLVSPNPMDEAANFVLLGYLPESDLRFALFDPMGRQLQAEVYSGNTYSFTKKNLSSGLYFWQIEEQGKVLARGRIVVK